MASNDYHSSDNGERVSSLFSGEASLKAETPPGSRNAHFQDGATPDYHSSDNGERVSSLLSGEASLKS
jgi:hypothetical protein